MFSKISNFLISGSILTAIIFASLGCNTDLESQTKQTSNLNELSQFETSIQNTSCNCLITDQDLEINQNKTELTEIKALVYIHSKPQLFLPEIQAPPLTKQTIQTLPNPPPSKWIKTLARGNLQS